MDQLLLHPKTSKQLDALLMSKPHALIISGDSGSGKKFVAMTALCQVLDNNTLESYPYFLKIVPVNQSISIDEIRRVKTFLSKKTTGSNIIRRAVFIDNAHKMTTEAQNSLLKILEEPPADTIVVLTVSDMQSLQSTIISRSQQLTVLPLSRSMVLNSHLAQEYSEIKLIKAYYMSGGRAGLLAALLDNDIDHEAANAIVEAKDILRMSIYERLTLIDGLSKQKEHTLLIIEGLQRIIISGLEQAAIKNNVIQVKNFSHICLHLINARTLLEKNANAKLTLNNLFLQM